MFFAWLDGELDPEASEGIAAKIAADPILLRAAEQHRLPRATLRQAFDEGEGAPPPINWAANPQG